MAESAHLGQDFGTLFVNNLDLFGNTIQKEAKIAEVGIENTEQ
jgi:hypothetical protein